jgi:hypothetical protein
MTTLELCDTTQGNLFDSLFMSPHRNYAILDDYLIIQDLSSIELINIPKHRH